MKNESFFSFIAGIMVGTLLGILIGDEDKKKIQRSLNKQAEKLRKEYEGPIRSNAAKVKQFVKENLA